MLVVRVLRRCHERFNLETDSLASQFKSERQFPDFHMVAKPTGAICNLDCSYCFYLEKESLYPGRDHRMNDQVLESFIAQYIAAQQGDEVHFLWQGGEPTLLGVGYYRQVESLQQKYSAGKRISNSLQTNGLSIDDDWCDFLASHDWLVGISIDGPAELHDRYRVTKGGSSTHAGVVEAIERLKAAGVRFNALAVLNRENAKYPLKVYEHLKSLGAQYIQFLPVVERILVSSGQLSSGPTGETSARLTPWSVDPHDFGQFLITVFDDWVKHDIGKVFVQIFDTALESWMGIEPSLCIFRKQCGGALAIEHNGDIYACDHYVFPEFHRGNIRQTPMLPIVESEPQRAFGRAKESTLPQQCRNCDVLFACRGECPKNRFMTTANGEENLNYLCAGYLKFFRHIDPVMRHMADSLRVR